MLETMLKYQETDKGLKELENELMSSEERRKTASAKKFLDTVNDSVARMDKRAEELAGIYESLIADYRSLEEASGEFQGATEGVEDEAEADYLKNARRSSSPACARWRERSRSCGKNPSRSSPNTTR